MPFKYLEKENQFQMKVKSALRYPMLVLGVLSVAFFAAVTMIVPRFESLFKNSKAELPIPTRMLLWLNQAIVNYWWLVLLVAIAIYFLFKSFLSSPKGRKQWEKILFHLPVVGDLVVKLALSRFFRMFSSMLESGIQMSFALGVTAEIADNFTLSSAITDVQNEISEGGSLSDAMKKNKLFPGTAIHMIAIGEKSGNLSEMLNSIANYFDEETDYIVSNLTLLLEPIMIFILAILVMILALGIFLPMWGMMKVYTG